MALLAVSTAWALSTSQDFDTPGAPFISVHVPSFGAVTSGPTAAPTVTAGDAFSSGQFMRLLAGGLFTRTGNSVLGKGKYDYLIGVYYPNEKPLAIGAKAKTSDRISW